MVLILNGKPVTFENGQLKALLSDNILGQEAYKFHSKTKQKISDNHNLIFLHQREKANVYIKDPAISFIGTDDMTTCHFVVLDCVNAGLVTAGHLDGAPGTTDLFFESFFSKLLINMNKYEHSCKVNTKSKGLTVDNESSGSFNAYNHFEVSVSMIGGFIDNRNYSNDLSCEIMKSMSDSQEVKFRLDLCAITDLNNKIKTGFNFPIQYGALYNLKSHEMSPADFTENAKEPHHVLRSTRFHTKSLYDIYDPDKNELVLMEFDYNGDSNSSYYKVLMDAPNEVLRRYSTSPKQEKADFEEHVRTVYKFMYQHPDPSVFYDTSTNSIRYKCNSKSGIWQKL